MNWWKHLTRKQKIYQVCVHLLAVAGLAVIAAWAMYQLGVSNNGGHIDRNNRYLANYKSMHLSDTASEQAVRMEQYLDLVLLSKMYPKNAQLIYLADRYGDNPEAIRRMVYAVNVYLQHDTAAKAYIRTRQDIADIYAGFHVTPQYTNAIPWMNDSNWDVLKLALAKDTAAIRQAAALTGVDARLIAGCTVGEQIRLFNTKREEIKQHLGPMAMTVQSQFSYGINGIKEPTAIRVERQLKDSTSPFYMGKAYEHLLDFSTEDTTQERVDRLTDWHHHLYSYIYTACILKQTMLQWKRAGYDISDRPDILYTLFNLGFNASQPHADPQCGGSSIRINEKVYTFGGLGYDFFYSGELAQEYPMSKHLFKD